MDAIEHQNCRFFEKFHLLLTDPRSKITSFCIIPPTPTQFPINKNRHSWLVIVDEQGGLVILNSKNFRRNNELNEFFITFLRYSSLRRRKWG
jgi:hypothetical protein